ncbi:hypothetical protein B0A48_08111 [Cryoendolithus antarcticus]|uniref:Uncharacterized protein n=1 Tax=Cryoendolithus antarcticus TaxID=1507870 RepID=A0A1V8T1F2_9PEZI|nr:hypothetical protein B0A48_08111 [Cryoendolithus antarcticus]
MPFLPYTFVPYNQVEQQVEEGALPGVIARGGTTNTDGMPTAMTKLYATSPAITAGVCVGLIVLGILCLTLFALRHKPVPTPIISVEEIAEAHLQHQHRKQEAAKRIVDAALHEDFKTWASRTSIKRPGLVPTDPLCVVCLETVDDDDEIAAQPMSDVPTVHGDKKD